MPYLMINAQAAHAVASGLAGATSVVDDVRSQVLVAASLAQVEIAAIDVLVGLEDLLRSTGAQLLAATGAALSFELPAIAASPSTPWNHVEQLASHNSYAHPGAIDDLYARGVRTFELDVHRGDPTDFAPTIESPGSWVGRVIADAVGHGGDRPDDWRIYHHSLDTTSGYSWFSEGLATIAALPATDPITVFVDNKDRFADGHSADAFDAALAAQLGSRLYRPQDLLARSPGAATLREAVDHAGWPTVADLQGRVMVVVTDEVAAYELRPITTQTAFVASPPTRSNADNTIFFNVGGWRVTADAVEDLRRAGGVVRVFGRTSELVSPNFRAVDFEDD